MYVIKECTESCKYKSFAGNKSGLVARHYSLNGTFSGPRQSTQQKESIKKEEKKKKEINEEEEGGLGIKDWDEETQRAQQEEQVEKLEKEREKRGGHLPGGGGGFPFYKGKGKYNTENKGQGKGKAGKKGPADYQREGNKQLIVKARKRVKEFQYQKSEIEDKVYQNTTYIKVYNLLEEGEMRKAMELLRKAETIEEEEEEKAKDGKGNKGKESREGGKGKKQDEQNLWIAEGKYNLPAIPEKEWKDLVSEKIGPDGKTGFEKLFMKNGICLVQKAEDLLTIITKNRRKGDT